MNTQIVQKNSNSFNPRNRFTNRTLDTFFDEFFSDHSAIGNMLDAFDDEWFSKFSFTVPDYPHNVKITGDRATIIEVAVPGAKKEEIDVNVDGQYLTITINRKKDEHIDEKTQYICRKIAERNQTLVYKLSSLQNLDKIEVKLDAGLLVVSIPVRDEYKQVKRQLSIN